MPGDRWMTTRDAWARALYGRRGFYRAAQPAEHFRTAPAASPLFAAALARLADAWGCDTVLDLGAGGGELLVGLATAAPRLRLAGADLRARPSGLPSRVGWHHLAHTDAAPEVAAAMPATALVVANELLDNIPCDVVALDAAGVSRLVEVDVESGRTRLGDPVDDAAAAWLREWWPLDPGGGGHPDVADGGRHPDVADGGRHPDVAGGGGHPDVADGGGRGPVAEVLDGGWPGRTAEVGLARDQWWRAVCAAASGAVCVAIDYGHLRDGRPWEAALRSYRSGRQRPVRFDGRHDVTSPVAVDSVAAAVDGQVRPQAAMLRAGGLTSARPDHAVATTEPAAYLRGLAAAGEAAELLSPAGFGGYWWVVSTSRRAGVVETAPC